MRWMYLTIVSGITGLVVGYFSSHALAFLQWGNMLVWGVIGIVIGFFCSDRTTCLSSGIAYGFLMSLSFLITGFQGASDKLPGFILFSFGLSVIGALGGLTSVFVGFWFVEKRWKNAMENS